MPGGVEVQSLKRRRQQSKKFKEKVDSMVAGGQNFLKAKLSVDCKLFFFKQFAVSNHHENYDTMGMSTDPNSGSISVT